MKETITNLKKVMEFGKKYKKAFYAQIFCCVVFVAANIILPILGSKQLLYLTDNIYKELFYTSLLILAIAIFNAFVRVFLRRNTQIFFRGVARDIQVKLGNEILKIEVSDIDKNTTGKFVQRIGSDTNELSHIFTMGMGHITGLISNIGIFVAVFVINKIAFLYYLLVTLILTIIYLIKVRKFNQKDKEFRMQNDKTMGLSTELIRGVRDIKMLNARKSFMEEIERNINLLSLKMFEMRNTRK